MDGLHANLTLCVSCAGFVTLNHLFFCPATPHQDLYLGVMDAETEDVLAQTGALDSDGGESESDEESPKDMAVDSKSAKQQVTFVFL